MLNVTVNGHAHPTAWPYPDTQGYTWRTLAVTIPITDLVPGTDVVQLGSDQGMVTSNVNIVLVDVPGGGPCCQDRIMRIPLAALLERFCLGAGLDRANAGSRRSARRASSGLRCYENRTVQKAGSLDVSILAIAGGGRCRSSKRSQADALLWRLSASGSWSGSNTNPNSDPDNR